jgi:hypothetical protein
MTLCFIRTAQLMEKLLKNVYINNLIYNNNLTKEINKLYINGQDFPDESIARLQKVENHNQLIMGRNPSFTLPSQKERKKKKNKNTTISSPFQIMDRHTRIPTTHNCSTITQKQFLVQNQMKKRKKRKENCTQSSQTLT